MPDSTDSLVWGHWSIIEEDVLAQFIEEEETAIPVQTQGVSESVLEVGSDFAELLKVDFPSVEHIRPIKRSIAQILKLSKQD